MGVLGEVIFNVFQSLLSSYVEEKIQIWKDKRSIIDLRNELVNWADDFSLKYDGTIVSTDSFYNYIKHYNVVLDMLKYFFDAEINTITENEYITNQKEKCYLILNNNGVLLSAQDQDILKIFFQQLLSKVKIYIDTKFNLHDKGIIYLIIQNRNEIWKLHDLVEKRFGITETELSIIISIISKIKPTLDENWFQRNNNRQIKNLGNRYLPEVNIPLEIQNVFNGISKNTEFKKRFFSIVDELLKEFSECRYVDEYKELVELIKNLKFDTLNTCDVNRIIEFLNKVNMNMSTIFVNVKLINKVNELKNYLMSDEMAVVVKPFAFIVGEGGVGKTHLIADTISKMNSRGEKAILLLGQHFSDTQDPLNNILSLLNLDCNIEDFLSSLNEMGEKQKSRIIIFIDALNEGEGKKIWPKHIAGIIELLKQYPWIGFVGSIRTPYLESFFNENDSFKKEVVQVFHHGFSSVEELAVRKYFEYFNIIEPTVPIINSEFSNPLFLRLFCEVYQNTAIDSDIISLNDVLNNYIRKKNRRIAAVCDYNAIINVVENVITDIQKYKYNSTKSNFIKIEKVIEIVVDVEKKYNIKSDLLSELISEGVLTQNIDRSGQEYIYVTYEKLEDYIYAKMLVAELKDSNIDDFSAKHEELLNYGDILNVLSIVIPENFNYELADIFKNNRKDSCIIEAFIDSLIWRNTSTITEKSLEYINEVILEQKDWWGRLLNVLIQLSVVREHPLNSNKLCEYILSCRMSKREDIFIPIFDEVLNYENSAIDKMLNWCSITRLDSKLNSQTVKLAAQTIACFLITSSNTIRDKSTKALVNLLSGNIDELICTLEMFKDPDDSYISERLYAVAFSCAVSELNNSKLRQLAKYVYSNIFDGKFAYSNILLCNYAKNIIDYAYYILGDSDNLNKVMYRYCQRALEPNINDIDPTVSAFNNTTKSRCKHENLYSFPNICDSEWLLRSFDDLPDINKFVGFDFDSRKFLLLSGLYKWTEDRKYALSNGNNPKNLWIMVRSYIVKKDDLANIYKFLINKDLRYSQMVGVNSNCTLLNKENYWSERYKKQCIEDEWREFVSINSDSTTKNYYKVMYPTIYYSSGNLVPSSYIDPIEIFTDSSFWYKPCGTIFDGMKLRYGKYNTALYNNQGKIVCFDTSEILDEKIGLIIEQQSLNKFLEKNDYKIFWITLCCKNFEVTSYRQENEYEFYGRPHISGVYYINDEGNFVGEQTETNQYKC